MKGYWLPLQSVLLCRPASADREARCDCSSSHYRVHSSNGGIIGSESCHQWENWRVLFSTWRVGQEKKKGKKKNKVSNASGVVWCVALPSQS